MKKFGNSTKLAVIGIGTVILLLAVVFPFRPRFILPITEKRFASTITAIKNFKASTGSYPTSLAAANIIPPQCVGFMESKKETELDYTTLSNNQSFYLTCHSMGGYYRYFESDGFWFSR